MIKGQIMNPVIKKLPSCTVVYKSNCRLKSIITELYIGKTEMSTLNFKKNRTKKINMPHPLHVLAKHGLRPQPKNWSQRFHRLKIILVNPCNPWQKKEKIK